MKSVPFIPLELSNEEALKTVFKRATVSLKEN